MVGSADLETGVRWIVERLGVAPTFGGIHDGWGTLNALLGLGEQYLEVLALDPGQPEVSIPWCERLRAMTHPALLTVAVARSPLSDPVPMALVRADGIRMEWELQSPRRRCSSSTGSKHRDPPGYRTVDGSRRCASPPRCRAN